MMTMVMVKRKTEQAEFTYAEEEEDLGEYIAEQTHDNERLHLVIIQKAKIGEDRQQTSSRKPWRSCTPCSE